MTKARFHTTITERASFRSCRRQWYLENIERLAHGSQVMWNLVFGECVHKGLEVYYTGFARDLDACLQAFEDQWKIEDQKLRETYMGIYTMGIDNEWWEYKQKGELMLTYYDQYDKQSKFWKGAEILDVNIEDRGFVDILDLKGLHLPSYPLLSGRIDLVLKRKDGIYIMDHKTAASAYDARALDVDDQLTGYAYIYYRLTGTIPRGCVYNALIKEPPHPPKVLKSGAISQDKAQRTTYDLYIATMQEQEINVKDPDYAEFLAVLKEKAWYQFFLRDEVRKIPEEIESFEKRLHYEYMDMERARDMEGYRYPNPTQRTCPGCSVLSICLAMEEQSDVEYVRESMYVVQEPRHEVPAEVLSPKWKGV